MPFLMMIISMNRLHYTIRTLLIFIFSLTLLSSCTLFSGEEPEMYDETKGMSAKEIYDEARGALAKGAYSRATELYTRLTARFPHDAYSQQAMLEMAYAYYKDEDPESSISEAERFIKTYPKHPHIDYAYYIRGLATFPDRKSVFEFVWPQDESIRDPRSALRSYQYFDLLVRKFPNSLYTQDSLLRMQYLKNKLAKHEIHVANYYFKKGAYVASINRANYVIKNLQQTPAVGEALKILIKSYEKLGMNEQAQNAHKTFELNKSKGKFVDEVFLEQKSILPDFLRKWISPE